MAQAAVAADAGAALRIVRAQLAGTAGGDVRSDQGLDGKLGSLVDGQAASFEARDGGLIQSKPLAELDLRQSKLAPDIAEIVHG